MIGINNIDNVVCICYFFSIGVLKIIIGVVVIICFYKDWIGIDLLVFIGFNVVNN